MSRTFKKLLAILLALWLPLFSGNILAAAMHVPAHGACHEMAAMQDSHTHANQDADQKPCNCHQACCCYLGVQEISVSAALQTADSIPPYLFSFHTVSSIPLLPPPLKFA